MDTLEYARLSETVARFVGDGATFAASYWRRAPGVFQPAPELRAPLTLDDLDELLRSGAVRVPYVEMTRPGQVIPLDGYTVTHPVNGVAHRGFAHVEKIRNLLDDGCTLLMRNLEQWHRPTAELTARLAEELGRKVEAFFFVTPPGCQGLPLHRDDADVFVLQVNGSKDWRVHGAPENGHWGPGPLPEEEDEAPFASILDTGQVLYIPRGFAHRAAGARGLSAHLSLTVRDVGSTHLYQQLQHVLLQDYTPAPRPLTDVALLRQAEELIAHMSGRLSHVDPGTLLADARASLRAEAPEHGVPRLSALAAELDGSAPNTARSVDL